MNSKLYTRRAVTGFAASAPFLAATTASAAPPSANDLQGVWKVNGNGYLGDLTVARIWSDTDFQGTIYAERMRGRYWPDQRRVIFLRELAGGTIGPVRVAMQVFVGDVSPNNASITGQFHALTAPAGGTPNGQVYTFGAARRVAPRIGRPPRYLPQALTLPSEIEYQLLAPANGGGSAMRMKLSIGPSGEILGTLDGSTSGWNIYGYASVGVGTIAFTASYAGTLLGFFVGAFSGSDPTRPNLSGEFYPLGTIGSVGPDGSQIEYGWTGPAAQSWIAEPLV